MALGTCIQCGHPVGSGARPCRHCGEPNPIPAKVEHKCATCAGIVLDAQVACRHCAAPTPLVKPPGSRLGRCAACSAPVSTAADKCARCATPVAGKVVDAQVCPVCQRGLPHDGRPCPTCAAAALRKIQLGGGRPAPGPAANPTPPAPGEPVEPAAAAGPTAAAASVVDCPTCGRKSPVGDACVHCGLSLRLRHASGGAVPVRVHGFGWVRGAAALMVLALAGGAWALGRSQDDGERRRRVWQALGDGASEARVAEMERDAAALEVSTDALVRVRRLCILRPQLAPDHAMLRTAAEKATQAGRSRDQAVVALAAGRCR